MSNKLCSVMMSMIPLLTCSGIQSMKTQRGLSEEAEVRLQRYELGQAEKHGQKFQNLYDELKQKNDYKSKFNNVMVELDWFEREPNQAVLDDLETIRDCVLYRLIKNVTVNLNSVKEEKSKFRSVLAELKRHDNSEEEGPQDFHASFEQEFADQQAEKAVTQELAKTDAEVQEAAFSQLTQSLVSLEGLQQDIPGLFDTEEKAVEQVKVEAVTVSWGTWFKDKLWGASNLTRDLSDKKISLAVLKESPDMQSRINYMIARYSLATKRDNATLLALVDLYTALDALNFKFVDAQVNSALYDVCRSWLAEEEKNYTDTREARVLAIATYLTSELDKMALESAPRVETMKKLDDLKWLVRRAGAVEVSDEQKLPYISEPIVLETIGHLEKLALELTAVETTKEEVK